MLFFPILTSRLALTPAHPSSARSKIARELSQPFNYFSHPTDQLGFPECPVAAIVTYDGAFLTPYGQISFYIGTKNHLVPVHKRVKTFLNNDIPVLNFQQNLDGLSYQFQAFSMPLGLKPQNDEVLYIRCTIHNFGSASKSGELATHFGAIDSNINLDKSNSSFSDQRKTLADVLGVQRNCTWYTKPILGTKTFQIDAQSTTLDQKWIQQGNERLMYLHENPDSTLFSIANRIQPVNGASYTFQISGHSSKTYTFICPVVPITTSNSAVTQQVANISYPSARQRITKYWEHLYAKADHFYVDDPKVMATFNSSLAYDAMAQELNSNGFVYQRTNKLQYNYMWIRDGSFFVRAYDLLGMNRTADKILKDFLVWQNNKPTEFYNPKSPEPKNARLSVQQDYWGHDLWAFGEHIRMSHDWKLLKQIYPLLKNHIELFQKLVATDPRGLWPVSGPYDNELINGHYTGHSLWAILGLRYAVWMANESGHTADAANWSKILNSYRANFLKQLNALTAKSDGYMPPGMDDVTSGFDWANATAGLFPFHLINPKSKIAKNTLRFERNDAYQEGIMTYAGGNAWDKRLLYKQGKPISTGDLHDYETFDVIEGNIIEEAQKNVVEDLYSTLVHTSSCNGGFETSIAPWGNRDPGGNFPPHGWFAARYIALIRDMLVREHGTHLHLCSVLAPDWVKPGRTVKVLKAPTFFGPISYQLKCSANDAELSINPNWRRGEAPTQIIFHIPWFLKVTSARANGRMLKIKNGAIVLPPIAEKIELKWTWVSHPALSERIAVKDYLEKYYHPSLRGKGRFLFSH